MSFSDLGLTNGLLRTLTEQNWQSPTPIQQAAIPEILAKKDVMAAAQTGTGKTGAFGLPLLSLLHSESPTFASLSDKPRIRSLILTPTRELAQQVFDHLSIFAAALSLKIVVVYGGTSMRTQVTELQNGADILVATPGRLLDHAHVGTFTLADTQHLILDEADRLLDMGFEPDLKRILRRLPKSRQTLLFSATFSPAVKRLGQVLLSDPEWISVTPENTTAVTVSQKVYPVDKVRKSELLAYLIGSNRWPQVLVFVKTKQAADALVGELKLDGITADAIHGDKAQGARTRALDAFKAGEKRVLIATDVAARGLDIESLACVINYHLPFKAEDYIHRIGRTGRAGCDGLAITLMSRDEEPMLKAIERLLDERLPQEWLAGYEPTEAPSDLERPVRRNQEKRRAKAQLHKFRGQRRRD